MGIITTAAINVNKLFQVCPDTNEDVPEKKSLIAPTHGISDDATPTTKYLLPQLQDYQIHPLNHDSGYMNRRL